MPLLLLALIVTFSCVELTNVTVAVPNPPLAATLAPLSKFVPVIENDAVVPWVTVSGSRRSGMRSWAGR